MAKTTFLSWSQTAGNNQDIDGIGILGSNAVANFDNAFRTLMAQLRRDIDGKIVYANKSANYTAVADDNNAVHRFTAAATVSLTAAATLGDSWHYTVFADGGAVIIDPNASELINGATTYTVQDGNIATIICDGSAFRIFVTGLTGESINGGPLSGFRNKIINGAFDIWQRATSLGSGTGQRYAADRWANRSTGSTYTVSRQDFALGTALPSGVSRFYRVVVASVANFNNFMAFGHTIESVTSLAGKTATLTFYAKADAAKNIAVFTYQYFGSGGSPSAQVDSNAQLVALTTSWQRFDILLTIPSVSGKTLGTDGYDSLGLVFYLDAGGAWNAQSANLGQQSGTFDFAKISVVEGDARAEIDPFSPRHIQQETDLCQRYYEAQTTRVQSISVGTGSAVWPIRFSYAVNKRILPTLGITASSTSGAITGATTLVRSGLDAADYALTFNAIDTLGSGTFALTADAEL